MNNEVVLGLGGNQGEVIETLKKACVMIESFIGSIKMKSSYYQTEAWGRKDQPDFVNQIIVLNTFIEPSGVLEKSLFIEKTLGRQRNEKWGGRVIDIDIISYGNIVVDTEPLKLPHPYLSQRNFVLYPLEEIYPDWTHPITKKKAFELKLECKDKLKVTKL